MENNRAIKIFLSEDSLIANKQKVCTVSTRKSRKSTFNTLSNLNMHLGKSGKYHEYHGITNKISLTLP